MGQFRDNLARQALNRCKTWPFPTKSQHKKTQTTVTSN